jgi:hypothetical protein
MDPNPQVSAGPGDLPCRPPGMIGSKKPEQVNQPEIQ